MAWHGMTMTDPHPLPAQVAAIGVMDMGVFELAMATGVEYVSITQVGPRGG